MFSFLLFLTENDSSVEKSTRSSSMRGSRIFFQAEGWFRRLFEFAGVGRGGGIYRFYFYNVHLRRFDYTGCGLEPPPPLEPRMSFTVILICIIPSWNITVAQVKIIFSWSNGIILYTFCSKWFWKFISNIYLINRRLFLKCIYQVLSRERKNWKYRFFFTN